MSIVIAFDCARLSRQILFMSHGEAGMGSLIKLQNRDGRYMGGVEIGRVTVLDFIPLPIQYELSEFYLRAFLLL